MEKHKLVVAAGAIVAVIFPVCIYAAASIGSLQSGWKAEIVQTENEEKSAVEQFLEKEDIYVDQADSTEYMEEKEDGTLVPTKLSQAVDEARKTESEEQENGKNLVESIPTVEDILCKIDPDIHEVCKQEYAVDLSSFNQLTYMMDMKYLSTKNRVTGGDIPAQEDTAEVREDGTVKVRIHGGEIMRKDDDRSIYLIHIHEKTEKITILKMEDYDAQTGNYTVVFPGIGPYMVVQSKTE